jgi:hypothetical protein
MGMGLVPLPARRALALAALCLLAPAAASALDADRDGVGDAADNCRALANPAQRDSDDDGYGNACDADFDQNNVVGWPDWIAVVRAFGAAVGDPAYDAELDLDGDGGIGSYDLLETERRIGAPPGPSGLSCAGETPCHAGLVRLDLAEEVLSRSVRLAWRAASPALVFDVERRVVGGAFERVARVWGSQREFVDRGAGSHGLAPGSYEYRVAGGGPWSETRRVAMPEECAGQAPTSPLLFVVEIVDHEPDGDHDGADVAAALAECSRLRGCVLRALPVVYEDVNVELALDTGYDFSRGLVIEGYGSASVFRSRVFSQADHDPRLCAAGAEPLCYRPRPVFSILNPGRTRLDGVRFRNFRIEGRKRDQPDPGVPWYEWQHWGIALLSSTAESTDDGCFHNVSASGLMHGGLGVQRGRNWIFEHNDVRDIGCQDDLTPCDALERTPDYLSIPGVQSPGDGIVTGELTEGTVMRHNRVVRTAKTGIAAISGASGFRFHDNVVEAVGGTGVYCNSCGAGVFERNQVLSMHYPTGRSASWPDGYGGDVAHGIQCVGSGHHLSILDNLVLQGGGNGIRLHCVGPGVVVAGNVVLDNCRRHGSSLVVVAGEGALLSGNVFRDHPGGCTYSVLVNAAHGTRIEGGSIESGGRTQMGLFAVGTPEDRTTGLLLRRLRITGRGSGTGIYLAPTSSDTTIYDSTCISGFPTPLVDASSGATTRPADPAGACSP